MQALHSFSLWLWRPLVLQFCSNAIFKCSVWLQSKNLKTFWKSLSFLPNISFPLLSLPFLEEVSIPFTHPPKDLRFWDLKKKILRLSLWYKSLCGQNSCSVFKKESVGINLKKVYTCPSGSHSARAASHTGHLQRAIHLVLMMIPLRWWSYSVHTKWNLSKCQEVVEPLLWLQSVYS